MFKLLNVTHVGGRGRPAHPREYNELSNKVFNSKGIELGEFELVEEGGAVYLTAVIDGKTKTITFPAKAGRAPVAKRTARKATVTKATKTVKTKSSARKTPAKRGPGRPRKIEVFA